NFVYGNQKFAPDFSGTVTSLGHNFIGQSNGSTGWQPSDLVGTTAMPKDPKFLYNELAPAPRNLPPLRGSPLIDAGDDSVLGAPLYLATDQRGGPRRTLAHVDIGAVEVGSALRITRLQPNGGAFDISFATEFGFPHHLESKDTLAPGSWTAFGPIAVVGDGNETTVRDTRPRAPTNCFYRVVLAP